MQSFVGKLTHACPDYYCSRSARPRALPAGLSVVAADWPHVSNSGDDGSSGVHHHDLGLGVSLTLSARTYIGKLVAKYLPKPLAQYAPVRMPADHSLSEAYGAALERTDTLSGSDYPSRVGALIYGVPCGRIDVAYVVGILARCLTFPTASQCS